MMYLSKDIEDLYRRYLLDYIEGLEIVTMTSFKDSIFYIKNDKVILQYHTKKNILFFNDDLYSFLENSIGLNNVLYLIQEIFKNFLNIKKNNFNIRLKNNMGFDLLNVHYGLCKTLNQINVLKQKYK